MFVKVSCIGGVASLAAETTPTQQEQQENTNAEREEVGGEELVSE